jgi:hypothetical protein
MRFAKAHQESQLLLTRKPRLRRFTLGVLAELHLNSDWHAKRETRGEPLFAE